MVSHIIFQIQTYIILRLKQNAPLAIIYTRVIKKLIFKENNKNSKRLWYLKFFELVVCNQLLNWCHLCWQLVSHVIFQIQADCTIIFLKLFLLILYLQRLSRSEASNKITQIQRVSDVWTCFNLRCVSDIYGTIVFWVCCCAWACKVQFDEKCTSTYDNISAVYWVD